MGAPFSGADFAGTAFSGADFSDADFSAAGLSGTGFSFAAGAALAALTSRFFGADFSSLSTSRSIRSSRFDSASASSALVFDSCVVSRSRLNFRRRSFTSSRRATRFRSSSFSEPELSSIIVRATVRRIRDSIFHCSRSNSYRPGLFTRVRARRSLSRNRAWIPFS
ncbi:pentapeptide repeat-containing protein [Planctomyces sp. SH-PL14]|uniref:pentapeptide repeat-containing protein n=1 Tax=Planctomyces sp. SH-PL14 TaxID=1632864 RepID=UPI00094664CD